ncbi:MAG: response regulator [Myxococcales bacterium]
MQGVDGLRGPLERGPGGFEGALGVVAGQGVLGLVEQLFEALVMGLGRSGHGEREAITLKRAESWRGVLLSRAVRILVVDDDLELCTLLSRFLERHGFDVTSAGDALQALDALEREPIDFVITDLMMPMVDGLAFLEAVRSDPRRKNLPVIFVTAYPDDRKAEESLRKGAAFFLPKPVDFDRLLTIIRFAE